MGPQGRTNHREEAAHVIADAGGIGELQAPYAGEQPLAAVVSRLGNLRNGGLRLSFWMQLRGETQVDAAEGRFVLKRGDWIVFDPDSRQELQAMRDGLAVGLLLPDRFPLPEGGLLPGRGRANGTDMRIALNLWRRHASRPRGGADAASAIRPLLLHLQYLQGGLQAMVGRCPGRTIARKRQVLVRMQRVHMFIEGNVHRSVRLGELAELSRFSEWWVSKTFHAIYGETVQKASIRLRMQRARELLESTSLSISELGDACGFHDPCSFARLFKNWHGQTASRWRAASQVRGQAFPMQSPDFSTAVRRMGT